MFTDGKLLQVIIIIMDICKAPTLRLKALNKHSITHIMYIEMETVIVTKIIFPPLRTVCLGENKSASSVHSNSFQWVFTTVTFQMKIHRSDSSPGTATVAGLV